MSDGEVQYLDKHGKNQTSWARCSQCGQPLSARACGPTHALRKVGGGGTQ